MGKKNRANEYCDVCKKIHRNGKCTELSTKDVNNITANTAMALMMRATKGMYLSRDRIGDSEDFIESDIVKEGDESGSGGDSKENK
jgi:hypothetical protein